MSTIFTRIIEGEIPCYKIAENETHFSFLDINPIARGHTLVVPKKEIDYIFDLPDALLADTMVFAKKIASAIDASLSPIRTGVIVEGLEVPHAHIHLVPIFKDTQVVALGHSVEIPEEEMQKIRDKISSEVSL